jgi:hypothetical protein
MTRRLPIEGMAEEAVLLSWRPGAVSWTRKNVLAAGVREEDATAVLVAIRAVLHDRGVLPPRPEWARLWECEWAFMEEARFELPLLTVGLTKLEDGRWWANCGASGSFGTTAEQAMFNLGGQLVVAGNEAAGHRVWAARFHLPPEARDPVEPATPEAGEPESPVVGDPLTAELSRRIHGGCGWKAVWELAEVAVEFAGLTDEAWKRLFGMDLGRALRLCVGHMPDERLAALLAGLEKDALRMAPDAIPDAILPDLLRRAPDGGLDVVDHDRLPVELLRELLKGRFWGAAGAEEEESMKVKDDNEREALCRTLSAEVQEACSPAERKGLAKAAVKLCGLTAAAAYMVTTEDVSWGLQHCARFLAPVDLLEFVEKRPSEALQYAARWVPDSHLPDLCRQNPELALRWVDHDRMDEGLLRELARAVFSPPEGDGVPF